MSAVSLEENIVLKTATPLKKIAIPDVSFLGRQFASGGMGNLYRNGDSAYKAIVIDQGYLGRKAGNLLM